jgi:hypothetical protein
MKGPVTPSEPSQRALRRFFAERKACTVAEAAELTGLTGSEIRTLIASGEISLEENRIPWSDVALVFDAAWPPAVKESLVQGIEDYPSLLRTSPVTWRLPRYLVVALNLQAGRAGVSGLRNGRQRTVDEIVGEHLHLLIDEETVRELGSSEAFRAAYFFPEDPE